MMVAIGMEQKDTDRSYVLNIYWMEFNVNIDKGLTYLMKRKSIGHLLEKRVEYKTQERHATRRNHKMD